MKLFRKPKAHLKDVNMKKLFRRNQIIVTALAVMIAAAGYLNYAGNRDLAASTGNSVYEAGALEISDEDLLAENQASMLAGSGLVEEAQPQAEADNLQEEAGGLTVDVASGGEEDLQLSAIPEDGTELAEIESWDEGEETGIDNPGEAVLTSGVTVADYIAGVQLNREQIRAKNKETLNSIINNTNIDEASKQEAIQNMVELTEIAEKENAAETLLMAKGFADPVVSVANGRADVVINASVITDQQRAQIEDIVKRKTEVPADGIVITLLKLDD